MKRKYLLSLLIITILSTPLLMSALPSADAAVVIRDYMPIFAYIGAYPDPIGVGQSALVTYRVDQPIRDARVFTGHANGTSVTITKPDGTTEIKSNLEMDSTSSGWFSYIPNQIGTYTFQMHFPEQVYWSNSSSTQTLWKYAADDSSIIPLEVQEDPIPGYDRSPPLPTEPWSRPIYAENKGWGTISDNWLMIGYDQTSRSFAGNPTFAPYTTGPHSPHIIWTKSIISGGVVGGKFGDYGYYTGISYEQFFDAMVLQGHILYSEHAGTSTTSWGTRFIDLYTGEDLDDMYMPDVSMAYCQVVKTDNPNEHGAIPYIWDTASGGRWLMYDFIPGQQPKLRLTLEGMSGLTGTTFPGPNGELLSIQIAGPADNRYMYMFNSSRAIAGPYSTRWNYGGTINASRYSGDVEFARSHSPYMGIEWNVTLGDIPDISESERLIDFEGGWVVADATDSSTSPYTYTDVGYNIGSLTKNAEQQYPSHLSPSWHSQRPMINDIHNRKSENLRDGYYVRFDEGAEIIYCFDVATGQLRWQSDSYDNAWGLFSRIYLSAYNTVTTSGFDGKIRNWDADTGELRFTFDKGSSGFENAYGTYPEYAGLTIADGTIYTTADEHSSDAVLWRGAQLWAIDIETGELEFQINGMYRHPVVVDGILIALNSYDGKVYAFGKGPSKTTVAAPQTQVTLGEQVVIQGTVTDQTPEFKDTAAVSDASMGAWMEYMTQQKVYPSDATGVEVMIDVIDSNGNYRSIGTTTSTTSGFYDLVWTPDIPGKFSIIATFAGSKSYGSSWSETSMTVVEAPPPEVTPTPTPPPPTETYIAGSTIAILAGLGIAVFLLLRKK